MSRKMLINASHPEENRVAIVVDGILSELDIELAGQEQTKGNIYKAVVVRVETGLQAAFVDYGAEKLGFLQIGEIHPKIYPPRDETKGRPRIADILQRGQEIMVQIVKEERGNKGAALTTYLSIPGRYMVLMPDSTTKGVSRKISEDSERKKLKRTMAELDLPEKMGYIVRTAGIGKDKDELKRDFDYLVRLYEGIVARKDQIKAPSQLYQESNLAIRSIRDYFSTDMDEVLIDNHQVYQDTKDFFALVMPELKHMVKRHRERRPIFSRYQIEEQIEGLAKNQTALPSGGSIVMDQTEALVAIDVNSGKMASESGIEATALKTNLEAAMEVGRQLRLRDLGGLVVIDFIDMRDRKNIREVEQQLRNALKDDKAKVSVGRISQFGLMEMSRQRLKPTLSVGSYEDCPHCKGAGRIRSVEAQAVSFLRQAHTAASKGQIGLIEVTVPVDVANYLLNQKRSTIIDLERQLNLRLSIQGSVTMLPGESQLELHKKEKEPNNTRQIQPISHANQIEVALAAQQDSENDVSASSGETDHNQTETTEAPDEPPKKRRRRRRKKPAATEMREDSQQREEATTVTAESESATEPVEALQQQDGPERQEQTVETTDSEEKKPRRRGRRPSRRRNESTKDTSAETGHETAAAEAEEQPEPVQPAALERDLQTNEQPEKQPTKKTAARKPRQSSKKSLEDKPAEATDTDRETGHPEPAEAAETVTGPAAEADAESVTPAQTTTEETSPKKTRRSPRKKLPANEEVAPEATAEEEKPKRRPRRSSSKKAEEVKADPEAPVSEPIEQKPKRRARKSVSKSAEGQAEPPSPDAQAAKPKATSPRRGKTTVSERQTEAEEGKKTTRQPRKSVAPKKEEALSPDTLGEQKTEEKPKPKPRRAAGKKTESATAEETIAASTERKETEKPKRRTRKPASPETTDSQATAPTTVKPATEEKAKPKRRVAGKTSPAAKATESASEPAQKPTRKRATQKKTEEPST